MSSSRRWLTRCWCCTRRRGAARSGWHALLAAGRAVLPLAEVVPMNAAVESLAGAYIAAGIVTADPIEDATHVALATVHGCRLLLSWDFRHLVHFERAPQYNRVNMEQGYQPIGIHSPLEVIQVDHEGD
jgi:hypothetical protein